MTLLAAQDFETASGQLKFPEENRAGPAGEDVDYASSAKPPQHPT